MGTLLEHQRDQLLTLYNTDSFFGNVCELDLVFNFYKVYAIIDEIFLAGEIEETSKHVVLSRLEQREYLPLERVKEMLMLLIPCSRKAGVRDDFGIPIIVFLLRKIGSFYRLLHTISGIGEALPE